MPDEIVELTEDVSASPYYNADIAPVPRAGRKWGTARHRRPVDLHVRLHPDLHARLVADRAGHELVAGRAHDLPRQPHRAGADGAQRPRRHPLRHPVPRLLPRVVRHPRRQRPGPAARLRRLRLVRHPDLDRRRGHLQDPRRRSSPTWPTLSQAPGSASTPPQLGCFLAFWAINVFVIYRGIDSIRLLLNIKAPLLIALGLLLLAWAYRRGGRLRADAQRSPRSSSRAAASRAVLGLLLPRADRQRRLLGDAVAEHPRLLPLRPHAARPGPRPGPRPADDDGLVLRSSASPSPRATIVIYGEHIWDPVVLLTRVRQPDACSRSRCSRSAWPRWPPTSPPTWSAPPTTSPTSGRKRIGFRTGGLITGVIGILIQPWKLVADPNGYIFTWLIGYSSLLGAVGGVLIADYYLIRKRSLDLAGPLPQRRPLLVHSRLSTRWRSSPWSRASPPACRVSST